MTERYRAGLIGCGFFARNHLHAWRDLGESVELVAVCDLARVLVDEVKRVYAETQSIRPGIAGEDAATVLLRHRSGAVSVVDCSYASCRDPDPFPEPLLGIEGREGSLALSPGLEPETSGRDNLKTYALVEAAYESARTRRAVRPQA